MVRRLICAWALCTLALSLFSTQTLAQTAFQSENALPLIRLSTFTPGVGEELDVTALDLTPETPYTVTLTDPAGEETVQTVQASAEGTFEETFRLEQTGSWQLTVEGDRLNALFDVRVGAAGSAADSDTTDAASEDNARDGADGLTAPSPGEATTDPITEAAGETDAPPAAPSAGQRARGRSLTRSLGRSGWFGVVSLLFAFTALHLTLMAKYWRPQSVNLERRRSVGRSVSPLSPALAIRYYSLTEKLVLLILLLSVVALVVLASAYETGLSWQAILGNVRANPWPGLLSLHPNAMNRVFWIIFATLFALVALFTLVWVFIPRMRWVANSPRSFAYHVLTVLVPGSGLADEMWGLLLIIPWALFGIDAMSEVFGWGFNLGFSLFFDFIILAGIYLLNLVSVIVEFRSYSRRMEALKQDNPELAEELGLRPSV